MTEVRHEEKEKNNTFLLQMKNSIPDFMELPSSFIIHAESKKYTFIYRQEKKMGFLLQNLRAFLRSYGHHHSLLSFFVYLT